jgi:hypothetical protein
MPAMPKQTTLVGVQLGFERGELNGEQGWFLTIIDPATAETIVVPCSEELKDTLVEQLTGGLAVVTELPPALARKMSEEGRS